MSEKPAAEVPVANEKEEVDKTTKVEEKKPKEVKEATRKLPDRACKHQEMDRFYPQMFVDLYIKKDSKKKKKKRSIVFHGKKYESDSSEEEVYEKPSRSKKTSKTTKRKQ